MSEPEVPCPRWCTRVHGGFSRFLAHSVTIADAQLFDLDVTVTVTLAEILGDPVAIGPFARICFEEAGVNTRIQLTPPQIRMLALALNREGGADMMANALRSAASAMDQAGAYLWPRRMNSNG
jgi:hypothetical protein